MPSRRVLYGAFAGSLMLVFGWLLWSRTDSARGALPPKERVSSESPPRVVRASGAQARPSIDVEKEDRQPATARETREERARGSLEAFLDWAQYPPSSRPIRERPDRIAPDHVAPRRVRLGGTDEEAGTPDEPPVWVVLRQDRYFVTGQEEVLFELSCVAGGAPVDCSVDQGVLSTPGDVAGPALREQDAKVALAPGDERGSFRARVRLDERGFGSYTGPVRLDVPVRAAPGGGAASFDLFYTSGVPAVWTGAATDKLEDGSLVMCAELRVAEEGRYLFDARVADATGEVFAFVSHRGVLAAGDNHVCFTVFGKLIRDEGAEGPFVLRDIEGMLLLEDEYPDRKTVPTFRGPLHKSAPYSTTDFSAAEWQSPWKAQKVAMWEETLSGYEEP